MSLLRHAAKSILEQLFGSRLAVAVANKRLRGARLVLAYHNVIDAERPAATGDRSLHLPRSQFSAQLDAVADAGLAVVRVDDAPPHAGAPPQLAITFDDAYSGALTHGVPELTARGFAATIFVAPGLLGTGSPWWDRLADATAGLVPAAIRETALREYAGDGQRILDAAAASGWTVRPASPEHRIATESELDVALKGRDGITLGAHTWHHLNLAAVAPGQFEMELVEPLRWLRARWGSSVIPWLAYPYGLESAAARAAVAGAGYEGALLVTGGWHRYPVDRTAVPRLNVTPGLSVPGFRSRLGGVL